MLLRWVAYGCWCRYWDSYFHKFEQCSINYFHNVQQSQLICSQFWKVCNLFFHNCQDCEAHFLKSLTLHDSYFTIFNIARHLFSQFLKVCYWYFRNFKQCATIFFTMLNSHHQFFSLWSLRDSFYHNMNSVRLMFSQNEAAEVAAQR